MLPIKNILNNIDLLVQLKELVESTFTPFVYIGKTDNKPQAIDTVCGCSEASFKLTYDESKIVKSVTVRLDRKVISNDKEDYIIYMGRCNKCKKVYWINYDPKEV